MKNKKLLPIVTSLLILTSCGEDNGNVDTKSPKSTKVVAENDDDYTGYEIEFGYFEVDTPNGVVECVYGGGYRSGGPSCNWEKFNKAK